MFSSTSPVVYTPPESGPVFERRPRQVLGLEQAVSLAGSIWTRGVVDDLGLSQSDYFVEGASNSLDLGSQVAAVVARIAAASSALSLIQANTVAGGRIESGGGSGVEPIDAIFDSTAAKGAVVFVSSNGHVDLAQADGEPQALAIGLAADVVLSGNPGEVITSGPFTNESWNLTPGLVYYLDPDNPGELTSTFPTTTGNRVVIIGAAVTPTQLNIEIHWAAEIGT